MTRRRRFTVFDHTADLGAYFYGDDPRDVFISAAHGLVELMLEKPPQKGGEVLEIRLVALDPEDLLVQWLNELLYYIQVRELVPAEIDRLALGATSLEAVVRAAPLDPAAQIVKRQIKAATYHQVEVRPRPEGWRAKVIFDV